MEHLILATVVVAVILAISGAMGASVNDFYSATANKVIEVAGKVGNLTHP